jgi:hypothetical protein
MTWILAKAGKVKSKKSISNFKNWIISFTYLLNKLNFATNDRIYQFGNVPMLYESIFPAMSFRKWMPSPNVWVNLSQSVFWFPINVFCQAISCLCATSFRKFVYLGISSRVCSWALSSNKSFEVFQNRWIRFEKNPLLMKLLFYFYIFWFGGSI